MALSNQLEQLAQQAKDLETSADALRTKNTLKMEKRKAQLHGRIDAKRSQIKADDAALDAQAEASMTFSQELFRRDLEVSRDEANARKAKRKAKRADHRADWAESDALDAVEYAAFVLQEAELAVLNAAAERSSADEKETVSLVAGNNPS